MDNSKLNSLIEEFKNEQRILVPKIYLRITHVVRSGKKLKPTGMMMPTCPHCNFITDGFEFSSEVRKVGK